MIEYPETGPSRPLDPLLDAALGPRPARVPLDVERLESVDCGSYVREKVSYAVTADQRVSAYVCVPKGADGPLPAVFCHHQHAGQFHLGKSEVVGLAGHPDQAYARELAERGFVTIAPDAIGFEERNWSPDGRSNVCWFELSSRLVRGRTLLASCLHEVSVALDHLVSRPEVDPNRLGFIGHSYGGRTALWAPAFDHRITASVSHCGCIPYRYSLTHDTGVQAEFVLPGFAAAHDLEDVLARYGPASLLISATTDDRWSRGAEELFAGARRSLGDRVELAMYEAGHVFTAPMRERAYAFLRQRC
ncbi:dienelactone hydrolase family protein [Micromonospora purpureochromogenes]|uniref:Dienelactone hydrolase n=1 Tax=Micromonospora purpureochromogenes TaxID=47872 RepID=A0ABX2RNI3_9ACTN|nr:prolyl oligopeptidase family serine peptidase [Micromonospora purpureochromogenes]NYF58102.1 dienelactone hydrolase [Micromonospora purpureochromogenes]